jgi:hypothetical protein
MAARQRRTQPIDFAFDALPKNGRTFSTRDLLQCLTVKMGQAGLSFPATINRLCYKCSKQKWLTPRTVRFDAECTIASAGMSAILGGFPSCLALLRASAAHEASQRKDFN